MLFNILQYLLQNTGKPWNKGDVSKKWVGFPFKYQPHKMVKHTQTIRQQFADEVFQCVWLVGA